MSGHPLLEIQSIFLQNLCHIVGLDAPDKGLWMEPEADSYGNLLKSISFTISEWALEMEESG